MLTRKIKLEVINWLTRWEWCACQWLPKSARALEMWQPFIIFTTRLWQAPGLQTWPAQIVCFDTSGLCGLLVPHAGCARVFRPRLSSQGVLEVMGEMGQLVQLIAGPYVHPLGSRAAALIPRGKPADICRTNPLWAPATPWWLNWCCSHPATRVRPRDWFRHGIQRRCSYTTVKKVFVKALDKMVNACVM